MASIINKALTNDRESSCSMGNHKKLHKVNTMMRINGKGVGGSGRSLAATTIPTACTVQSCMLAGSSDFWLSLYL